MISIYRYFCSPVATITVHSVGLLRGVRHALEQTKSFRLQRKELAVIFLELPGRGGDIGVAGVEKF